MRRLLLDTSVLIRGYHNSPGGIPGDAERAMEWARTLVDRYSSNAIVSPVYLEFICGAKSAAELSLFESFLSVFEVADEWEIQRVDLREAQRISRRVPPDGKRRQFADCLIRAMANRLNCDVFSLDAGFPR